MRPIPLQSDTLGQSEQVHAFMCMEKEWDTRRVWDEKTVLVMSISMLPNRSILHATGVNTIKAACFIHNIFPHFNSATPVTYVNSSVLYDKDGATDIQTVHDYRRVFRKYTHLAHTQDISGMNSNASYTRPIQRDMHVHNQFPQPAAARIRALFSVTLLFIDNYGFTFSAFQTRE
jgi:hypothetical protein